MHKVVLVDICQASITARADALIEAVMLEVFGARRRCAMWIVGDRWFRYEVLSIGGVLECFDLIAEHQKGLQCVAEFLQ